MTIAARLQHATALAQLLLDGVEPMWRRTARELFEHGEVATAIFGAEGSATRSNAAWREMFATDGVLPDALMRHLGEVARTRTPAFVGQLELPGRRVGAMLFAPHRGSSGVVAACIDTTDDGGAQASRMRSWLAAVSHELRAPLTTLLLWESVLRGNPTDPDTRDHALEAIHASAVLQQQLVGDLLDVARATSGKLRVDLRALDFAHLAGDVIEAWEPRFAAKEIVLSRRIVDDSHVEGDSGRLRQVLNNLLSNALKFTRPGGRVSVALEPQGSRIAFAITDTGCGIATDALPRLFQPFSQIDERAGGLGLGLAIARELVALHAGTIEVQSDGIGCGTTFTVLLPACNAQVRTSRSARHPVPLGGLRILVVDDDPRVRTALATLLDRWGARTEAVDCASAARDVIARQRFDVMICDIAMPVEDGYRFIRALRASGDTTPAIALSARTNHEDVRCAHDAGFDLHVAKPVDFEHLVASIHATIEAR